MLRAIEQQVLRPGMSLPSVRELARQYEISTFTVASAYSRLVSLGWLAARRSGLPGGLAGRARAPGRAPSWEPPRLNAGWLVSDIFADHSIPIKSGCGWLPGNG